MLVPGAAEGLRTIIFIAVTKMNVLPLSLSTFPHLPPFTASPPPLPPMPLRSPLTSGRVSLTPRRPPWSKGCV